MTKVKTVDDLLDEAISAGNLLDVMHAIGKGADVIRLNAGRGGKIPLFEAFDPLGSQNAEIQDFIIGIIAERSRVVVEGVLDKVKTREALNKNLLYRTDAQHRTFVSRAVANANIERLATLWNNLKTIGDININDPNGDGIPLVHYVTSLPDNLAYLLSEGGRIDAPNRQRNNETPIMKTLRMSHFLTVATTDALLATYEHNHVNLHAVDNNGRGLAHHMLRSGNMGESPSQEKLIDWLLKNGVDFMARDTQGKTPTDYLMEDLSIKSFPYLNMIFYNLAAYGYNVPVLLPLLQKNHPVKSQVDALEKGFLQRKAEICRLMAAPDLLARLWNPDDSPSPLLFAACGYGVVDKIFEDPCFKGDLPAARALYGKMEAKLPPHCQIRTGIDLSFLRDENQPQQSSAIATALKRKSASGKLPGGEGRTGK